MVLSGEDSETSALAEACATTSRALPLPPKEGADLLAGLGSLDDQIEQEGSDPEGDFARVVIAASTYRTGATSAETLGGALARFRDTCDAAGHSFEDASPTTADEVPESDTTEARTTDVSTATAEAGVTEPDVCPGPPAESPTPEIAAQCLYVAYKAGDPGLAGFYASEEAIDSMFETPWEPPEWSFQGCEDTQTVQPTCGYFIPDSSHGVGVEMLMSYGASMGAAVMEVAFYG